MSGAAYSVNFSAKPVTGSDITKGWCLVADDDGNFIRATLANRGSRRSDGIAVTGSEPGASPLMVTVGRVENDVTSLGPGAASWVRVNDSGFVERCAAGLVGSDYCGWCEADGTLHAMFGFLNGTITGGPGVGTLPNATAVGQELRAAIPGSPTTWVAKETGQYYVSDYGIVADCTIGNPSTGTDQSAAIQSLVNLLSDGKSHTIFFPEAPPGLSYRIDKPITIYTSLHIKGVPGAKWGAGGSQITLGRTPDHGTLNAFQLHNALQAQKPTSATGAVVESLTINVPDLTVRTWSSGLAVTAGDFIKPTTTNVQLMRCLVSGNLGTTEPDWFVDFHIPQRSDIWSAGMTVYYGKYVRPTNQAHWNSAFFAVTPVQGGASVTTGGSEPAWDFTVGHTTTDGGVVWRCDASPFIAFDGTAVLETVFVNGVFTTCQSTITDVCVKGCQGPGLCVVGSDVGYWGDNARGVLLESNRVVCPSSGGGVGIYARGGNLQFVRGAFNIVEGSSPIGLATQALGYLGTDVNEHGIQDSAFAGVNVWIGNYVKLCGGYDYRTDGNDLQSMFYANMTDAGRVYMLGGQWMGHDVTFWNTLGEQKYMSTAISAMTTGAKNWIGISNSLTHTSKNCIALDSYSIGPVVNHITSDDDSLGQQTARDSFTHQDWWMHTHHLDGRMGSHGWSTQRAYWDDGDVRTAPLGPNVLTIPRGILYGHHSSQHQSFLWFPSVEASQDRMIYGCYRPIGTRRAKDPQDAAGGAFLDEVVTTAGYEAPVWQANHTYFSKIDPPADPAYPADFVVPTVANGHAYECTTFGASGSSEPTWPTTNGNTVSDGSVVWTCRGPLATWADCNPVDPLPGGGSPASPSTSVQFNNSGAFGGSANLTWDGTALTVDSVVNTVSVIASAEVAVGAAPASVGAAIRLSNDGKIEFRDSGDSVNVSALNVDSAEAVILGGTNATAISAKVGSAETIRADGTTLDLKPAGSTTLETTAAVIAGAVPYIGLASPWGGVHGEISIDLNNTTPYTLSSPEYKYFTLYLTNDASSQVVVTPTPSDLAHSYLKIFVNVGEHNLSISNGGSDLAISTGQGILAWVRPDGVNAIAQFGAW